MRLLATEDEGAEHGYPLYLEVAALMGSDLDAAGDWRAPDAGARTPLRRRHARRARHLLRGTRPGEAGPGPEGLSLLDEAMLAALSDRLQPMWTGAIYCGLLDACHELGDLRRAHEWTDATPRWCSPLPVASLYPGICRVHQAGMLQLQGAWEEAEAEALSGLRRHGAHRRVRRRRRLVRGRRGAAARGDLDGAERRLRRSARARARPAARTCAAPARAGTCRRGPHVDRRRHRLVRWQSAGVAPLHAAQVDIALAAGDLETATASADVVTETAERFQSIGLRAVGLRVQGAVALARGEGVDRVGLTARRVHRVERARRTLRSGTDARAAGDAYALLDDDDAAERERPRHADASSASVPQTRSARSTDDGPGDTVDTHGLSPRERRCSGWSPGA